MSQKALKSVLKIADEAYEQALYDIENWTKPNKTIYDTWFAVMYALEGVVDDLCSEEEKLEYTEMYDKRLKFLRFYLKI